MIDASTLSAIALKTSLLVLAGGALSVILGKTSAAYRHLLWTTALALSLLMPLAILYLPSSVVIALPRQVTERLPLVLGTVEEGMRADGSSIAIGPTILLLWLIGASGLLLREAVATVGLMRWCRRAQPLESLGWVVTLDHVTRELGIKRPLRVLESAHVAAPCTWGCWKPVLLLPIAGARWPATQRRQALLHELAHIRRFDSLSSLLSRIVCAVHWYNPLVWYAAAQIQKLQERACDDAVLNGGGIPSDYAQFLLSIAEEARASPLSLRIAMAMARRSVLHCRVTAILDPRKARLQPNWLVVLVALAPLSCVMFVLATTVTATTSDEPEQPPPAKVAVELRSPVEPLDRIDPIDPVDALEPLQLLPPLEPIEPLPPPPESVAAVPAVPEVAAIAAVPALPAVPAIPAVPAVPAVAAVPAIPAIPAVPAIPATPAIPAIPAVPQSPAHHHEV